ncbi:MAG: hypothetical protein RLZZ618_2463 [Pseudomonadota bacterium]|jgi:alpha-ketoglutarate-dependent taurine dioxygenase
MNDLTHAGVLTLDEKFTPSWRDQTEALLEVVQGHQAECADYREVLPSDTREKHQQFQQNLLNASPSFKEFIERVRHDMLSSRAVFIPNLGLGFFDENTRALMAYAVASCLGNPTATDKKQVIWDVKAVQRDSSYFSTFSETDLEAAYHTDTQYHAAPEQAFLLYCMTPARCGGGLSSALDARALRNDIEAAEPWIVEVLREHHLPFRVPSAFQSSDAPDVVQATLAPIFAESPLIRYRRDTLEQGMLYFPKYAKADAHRALEAFEQYLRECPHVAEFFMPRDSLLIMDNHQALHARTSFQDHLRHMLRIRLAWETPTQASDTYRTITRVRDVEFSTPA